MNIRRLCYKLYKLDWLYRRTNYTTLANELKNYYKVCAENNISTLLYTFKEYLDELELSGASYDEFLLDIYTKEYYMQYLLNDEDLIEIYLNDLQTLAQD